MFRGYAYIDRGGTMRIAKKLQTAVDEAKKGTKIVGSDMPYDNGYPLVEGVPVAVCGEEHVKFLNGGETTAPALVRLYKICHKIGARNDFGK